MRSLRLSIDFSREGVSGNIESASISFCSTAIGSSKSSVSGGMLCEQRDAALCLAMILSEGLNPPAIVIAYRG
jgi:hypothetical protein